MDDTLPTTRRPVIAVVGASDADDDRLADARAVGAAVAAHGAVLISGGRGGVMAAASAGACARGGWVVGVLPGDDAAASMPNEALDVAVFTGMGQARNLAVVLSAAAVIAVGGGWGTLSEIALALKHRIPVVTLASWQLTRPDGAAEPLFHTASTPADAAALAIKLADRGRLGL